MNSLKSDFDYFDEVFTKIKNIDLKFKNTTFENCEFNYCDFPSAIFNHCKFKL